MDDVWFRAALQRAGATQADLARELDLAPSAISRILTGERQVKASEAIHLAKYLGVSPEEVLRHATTSGSAASVALPRRGRPPRVPQGISPARDDVIPILDSSDAVALLEREPVGHTPRPPCLAGVRDAYAVYVASDAMEPRYVPGWLLYVHPNKPAPYGRDVVAVRRGIGAVIGELISSRDGVLKLRQFNPSQTLDLVLAEIVAVHLVVGVNQEG